MIIREKVRIGDQVVTLETGRIAKQAGGSCLVRAGDTIVLVTACGNQDPKPGQAFFPMSVDYQEKTYSAGKIPGGFFKREGRLRDYEILTSRLIDRPCRPLFPEGYMSEVQIIATVMSYDGENQPDVLAMVGASAALHISQIPWSGPIAGVRVARVDGQFIANPTFEQMKDSDCELLIAASRDAIVMVEGEADEISEEDMIEALFFGHRAVQDTIDLIERMRQAVGKPKWNYNGAANNQFLKDRISYTVGYKLREACSIANKHQRSDAFKLVKREAVEILAPEFPGQEDAIKTAYEDLRYSTMRNQVLDEGRRLDGRDTRTVRPISIELGVLPRTHGSSLFTRGETQAIVTSTLGTARDAQRIDTLAGDIHKRFMLHYNFPPYSVGECKPLRGAGRREIGHGDLAERALAKMLPEQEQFPYTIRIVSEITESNGSSSMASVCGGALALMDAGVPIKSPVAGVAMGLIKEGERYAVLTDILGDEDALGDMDFKVCGTEKGVTAIQMDIKIEGLNREILERALTQAREARLHILDKMQRSIHAPREELSVWAPRITQIKVKPDQIRTIIGPGGKMIRAIVDQTGAAIDVEDDGTVNVASSDSKAVAKALEIIKSLTTEPEVGEIYEGTVKRIEPYGAFLEIMPGKDGLCHISDIAYDHVTSVEDHFKLGDKVPVKLTSIDREGRLRLSRKEALPVPAGGVPAALNGAGRGEPREERGGREERGAREERAPKRDFDRDERAAKPRDLDREERPARAPREDRPARPPRDFDRDDRAAKPRDLDREERVAKPRDLDREERPARARDELREERPVRAPRDLDAPRAPRDLDAPRAARDLDAPRAPRDLDAPRAARPPRDFNRDERPARGRDELREERPARAARDLDAPRAARDLDAPRPPRDLDAPRAARDLDAPRPPRDLDAPRPARAPRDLDAPRSRDLDAPRPRDLDRERAPRLPREERPLLADDRDDRPRGRDLDRAPRDDVRSGRRDVERKPRELDEEAPRGRDVGARGPRRDFDDRPKPPAPRDLDRDLAARPPRREAPRDLDAPARAGRPGRDVDARPARPRDDEFDREPARVARPRDLDEPRGRPALDEPRGRGPRRDDDREPLRARDDLRGRREPELDDRPRARRDERVEGRGAPARDLDDDRRPRPDSDRPSRARTAEPAGRDLIAGRTKLVRDDDDRLLDDDRSPAARPAAVRDDRVERDRPSRVRARARNRDRLREADRDRD